MSSCLLPPPHSHMPQPAERPAGGAARRARFLWARLAWRAHTESPLETRPWRLVHTGRLPPSTLRTMALSLTLAAAAFAPPRSHLPRTRCALTMQSENREPESAS